MNKVSQLLVGMLLLGVGAFMAGCGQDAPAAGAAGGVSSAIVEKASKSPVKQEFAPVTEIREGRKNVYAVLKVIKGDYWSEVVRGLKEGGEAANCNVYVGGAYKETDWQTQKEMLEELAGKKADAVILAPSDSVKLISTAEAVRKNNLPLILVDTVLNSKGYDAYLGTNNYLAGEKAAEEMCRLLKSKGIKAADKAVVAIKVSNMNSQNMVDRIDGINSWWNRHAPQAWTLHTKILNDFGDQELSRKLAEDAMQDIDGLKGFIACSNRTTVATAQAVKARTGKDIQMVGFDYAKETAAIIADPSINASTIVQNQYKMAFDGVAAALGGSSSSPKNVDTGVQVINIDNYKAYEAAAKK